jgi:hypothetical protein
VYSVYCLYVSVYYCLWVSTQLQFNNNNNNNRNRLTRLKLHEHDDDDDDLNNNNNHVYAAACLLGLRIRIPPGAWMSVSCECCVLSGGGLCEGSNPRPEEFYRVFCVECDGEASIMRRPWPTRGCCAKNIIIIIIFINCKWVDTQWQYSVHILHMHGL